MWIFSSLSRPELIRRVVDSYAWGGESQVLLTLYRGDKVLLKYFDQEWPKGWRIEVVDMLGNGPTYNEILRRYPDEPCYGFLADDAVLEVPGMLAELEREAGSENVAYANDQHHGEAICTMPCIGGDLVRRVGYLAPRNMIHWGVDCIWHEIGRKLGCLRYRPDLTYSHLHPLFGTGKWDKTYLAAHNGSIFYCDAFRAWAVNELPKITGEKHA